MPILLQQRIAVLDAQLIELAKPILLLKHLNWPDAIEENFIEGWRANPPVLPNVELDIPDWQHEIAALDEFVKRCDGDDPILQFLRRTARSYVEAGRMLMAAGTLEFTERSIRLYGRPDDIYDTQSFNGVCAAEYLLEKTDHLIRGNYIASTSPDIPAERFAERLQQALDGADFIDCFKLFLEAGQDEREAYKSSQRIFRGGDVRGGIAFTKDSAHLKGLMEAHVLMNVAIRDNQPQIVGRLFAGRLTMSDTITLGPYFESGFLQRPRYVPPWARDTQRLAATLAYSSFMMQVNLPPVTLDGFVAAATRSDEA